MLRLSVAWLLGAYLARMYIEMGWPKFFDDGFWTAAFDAWHYPRALRIGVGMVEVVGGVALVMPRLASYGALALVSIMLGAAVTRLLDGRWTDVGWIVTYLLGLVWIAFEWWAVRWGQTAHRARR
jgi:uncharacterized membrane protein YphA (DoxX/SURF4 family)